jgi:hypothetical protein
MTADRQTTQVPCSLELEGSDVPSRHHIYISSRAIARGPA